MTINKSRRSAICSLTSSLGLLIIAAALVIPITSGGFDKNDFYPYLYAGGALICLLSALFNPNTATDPRERRWHRIEAWSSIFFCAGAAFMFVGGATARDWLALTLAGAVLRIIAFVRGMAVARKKR